MQRVVVFGDGCVTQNIIVGEGLFDRRPLTKLKVLEEVTVLPFELVHLLNLIQLEDSISDTAYL